MAGWDSAKIVNVPPKAGWQGAKPTGRAAADQDAAARVKSTPPQVRALTQGFSFGFSDELDAGAAALTTGANNLVRRVTGRPSVGYGMKDAYSAVMEAEKRANNTFADEHPVQNVGLQIAGGIAGPGMATASRYIGGARSLLGATGRSAAVGAATGAAVGAGVTDGDLAQRARGAGRGAAVGAVVGGGMPSVGRVVQTAGRAANAAMGQPFGGAQRGAVARLRDAMQQDGLTVQQIQATIQQWQRSGVTPELLNVVGENTRALVRAAGSQQGGARNAAQTYRDTTVAGIPQRAQDRASQLTPGETRSPAQFVTDTAARRQTEAARNYPQWSNTPTTVPDTVKDMLNDPAGRQIIQRAMDDAVELQDWPRQAELQSLLDPTRNGQLSRISAGTVERLVQASGERSGQFAAQGANIRAGGAMGRREQLDGVLANISEVGPSRQAYSTASRAIEAAEGAPLVTAARSRFEPAVNDLSANPQGVLGAQIRNRQALVDDFGRRDQVRAQLGDLANAPDTRRNLEQLFPGEGDRFADAAGNLVQKQDHANYVAPNTNSQTQSREQDAERIFGTVRTMMEVAGGNLRPVLERMARGLTMTERERELLVQLGVGNPQAALQALAARPPPASRALGAAARRVSVATPGAGIQTSTASRPAP